MKLYEIDQNIRLLWGKIMDQDGELTEEDIQALESLEIAKDEKIKGYGLIIRETTAPITTAISRLPARSKSNALSQAFRYALKPL